jgi:hypothetical protein
MRYHTSKSTMEVASLNRLSPSMRTLSVSGPLAFLRTAVTAVTSVEAIMHTNSAACDHCQPLESRSNAYSISGVMMSPIPITASTANVITWAATCSGHKSCKDSACHLRKHEARMQHKLHDLRGGICNTHLPESIELKFYCRVEEQWR